MSSIPLERPEARAVPSGPRLSTWIFRIVVALLFTILLAQLWKLQIVDGRALKNRGVLNSVRSGVIPPQRGVIYDRNKTLLATNAPVLVVTITPAYVPPGRLPEIVIRLANELMVAPPQIQQVLDKRIGRNDYSPFDPVTVATDVSRDAMMRIAERSSDMPGVEVKVDSAREYTEGNLVSHLLGYVGPVSAEDLEKPENEGYGAEDNIGRAGVESSYEHELRGTPGKRAYQVEVTGQEVAELRREPAKAGNNLQLSIDLSLQRDVTRILQEGLHNTPSGAAIVMDPRSGEILAMVSTPTFDNNVIGDISREDELQALMNDSKQQPMFPRAYGGTYAPGSVFKLVTGSAALQEGIATRDTIIDSTGVMYVQNDEYPQIRQALRDNAAWGKQNFLQGLANSSNVYFFWLGGGYQEGDVTIFRGLGIENLAKYARAFGLGSQTGVDIPGEAKGLVPDEAWKLKQKGEPWYRGDTYNMSIGQGDVLVTPLQVANVTNVIANNGTLYQPHLGQQVIDPDGKVVRRIEPQARPVPVDSTQLALMREAMEFAFDGPHLKDFKIPGLRSAGKTGTAEFPGPLDATGNLPSHGWFTGFAPADNPVVSVTVFVDRGSGTADASPIGARILRRYFGIPDTAAPPTPTVAPNAPRP